MEIYLYHTPDLRGFLKSVMPNRYNEIVGVQHIKAYIFDDDIVMSGFASSSSSILWLLLIAVSSFLQNNRANLSESYFSNRQDRYIIISFITVALTKESSVLDIC